MRHDSPGTSFLMPKIMAKFELDHPLWGDKRKWDGLKLTTFDGKRAISKTVQDRGIVSIRVE